MRREGAANGARYREALGHHLVNVVVVAVVDTGIDAFGPSGPHAVADPAFAEGRNARGRAVGGLYS